MLYLAFCYCFYTIEAGAIYVHALKSGRLNHTDAFISLQMSNEEKFVSHKQFKEKNEAELSSDCKNSSHCAVMFSFNCQPETTKTPFPGRIASGSHYLDQVGYWHAYGRLSFLNWDEKTQSKIHRHHFPFLILGCIKEERVSCR